MTPRDFLTQFGLSERQIKIYLDLAANPESTVVAVNKNIKLPRSTIYLELQRLIQRGLVISKVVGKTTYFKITDPKALKLSFEDEESRLQELTSNLDAFNKTIKGLQGMKEKPMSVNIYKGQPGIKQLLWNIITSDAELVFGFSPGQLENITDRDFSEKWRTEFRLRHKHNKIIFNKPKKLIWSNVPGFLKENVEVKTLDENKIKFDRMILIYNDVITICSLKTDSDQYGVEIRDRLLFQSYKQMFDFIWDHVADKLTH